MWEIKVYLYPETDDGKEVIKKFKQARDYYKDEFDNLYIINYHGVTKEIKAHNIKGVDYRKSRKGSRLSVVKQFKKA